MRLAIAFLERLAAFIAPFAQSYGGAGLGVVAFLDSSFLSLPEVTDVAIGLLVVQHPSRWLMYAAGATIGSVAGCFTLYTLGRRGGEAFLRKRLKAAHLERGIAAFRRFGLLAIVVPAILPPPMPFKLFVLLAGVAGVTPGTFVLATAIGRSFRFGGVAILALLYGQQAIEFVRTNLATVSIWLAAAIVLGTAAFFVWSRRRRRT